MTNLQPSSIPMKRLILKNSPS